MSSRRSASPPCRRHAFPRDRSAHRARDNALPARPWRPRCACARRAKPLTGPKLKTVLSIPGRARCSRPDTASFTAFRTCRSCVTASTSPSDFAFRASMVLPVSISGIACIGLTSCVKRAVPPRPGCRPSITSGKPNRASSIAIRIWQASATSSPPPRQKPWITATLGTRRAFEPVDHRMRAADLGLDRARIGRAAKRIDVGAGNEAGLLGGTDDEAGGAVAFQLRQHLVEFLDQIGRKRIGAGALAIEQQPGDAVGIAGQLEVPVGPAASGFGPSSSTRSPRTFMIWLSMLTPSLSASRRPARRRYIRWRCRAVCPAASWR